MGLIQNGYRHNLTGRIIGVTNLDGANPYVHLYCGHLTARNRNQFAGAGITDNKAAVPNGNLPHSAWIMPRKPGGMSSRAAEVIFVTSANGLMGMPAIGTSTLTVAFAIADGQLITSGTGSSTITISGDTSQIVASLSGAGLTSFAITGATSLLGALASGIGESAFSVYADADILPEDDTSPLRTASSLFSFSGELTPFATGTLEGEAFLAGGEIDEFAVLSRMEYDNAVHVDVTNGEPGTKSPIGTLASPVNNITDALTIARGLNLNKIKFLSDYTLISGEDVSGYTLFSDTWKVITVESGAITTDTEFVKMSVYGELCGTWNVLVDCWAYNITNFLGWVRGGSIEYIELAEYIDSDPFSLGSSYFDDLVPMYAGINSVLVMNTGVRVSFTNSTDTTEIMVMEDGNVLNASLSGGGIVLDTSCTGGNIIVSGTGTLTNNSLLIVTVSGLNNENTAWGAIDVDNNVTGTMGNKLNSAAAGGVDLNAMADAVWSQSIEAGISAEEMLQIFASVLAGKVSGAGTGTETFKGVDGTTNRVISTVDDDGNRTQVIIDVT